MSIERRRMMMRSRGGVLPYPYKQVEYIESTGTQWIDAGRIPRAGDLIRFSYEVLTQPTRTGFVIGELHRYNGGTDTKLLKRLRYNVAENRKIQISLGNTTNVAWSFETNLSNDLGTFDVEMLFDNGNQYLKLNDVMLYQDNVATVGSPTQNLFMFDVNYDGSAHNERFIGRMKSYSIENNGSPQQNLVPCYDTTDPTKHTAGLYDIVNNQFYGNSGTGYFIVGPDV